MAHIHPLYDFVVSAYIVYDSRVLLVFHKSLQKWLPVGGHIELNEDPEDALYREIEEETGLQKKQVTLYAQKPNEVSDGTKFLPTPSFLDVHDISESHKHIGFTYFLESNTDSVIQSVAEHDDIKWYTDSDLDDPLLGLSRATQFYAKEALRLVHT